MDKDQVSGEPVPNETQKAETDKLPMTTTKVRRDFYQTESEVVVNIMVKNMKREDISVTFSQEKVEVQAKLEDGQDYQLILNLFGMIKPSACLFHVTKSKIEIKMKKDSAMAWRALEHTVEDNQKENIVKRSYPWNTKKDWNKLEKEFEKETEDDDSASNPFAAIFNCVDDDTKRAMSKSMEESGGTVLNMNWAEVGKKKIKPHSDDNQ